MSAMQHEEPGSADYEGPSDRSGDETLLAGTPVVVRRAAGLSAVIGGGASAIAIAYLWRAVETGAALDWGLCLGTALIAGFYLAGLLDARTPLVVADDLGVRLRLGRQWRGLPWEAVGAVEVRPRRSWLRDGRLVFRPHSLARALDGLEVRGRRAAALNQRMYGGALAVPLGLTTRTSTPSGDAEAIVEGLTTLSRGRSPVLLVVPEPETDADAGPDAGPDSEAVAATETDTRTDLGSTERDAADAAEPWTAHDAQGDRAPDAVRGPRTPTAGAGSANRTAGLWGALRRSAGPTTAAPGEPTVDPVAREAQPSDAAATTGLGTDEAGDVGETLVGETTPARRSLLGGIGTIVSRVAKGTRRDVDHDPAGDPAGDPAAEGFDEHGVIDTQETGEESTRADGAEADRPAARTASPVMPLRSARPALRAEVTRDAPATTLGSPALGAAALHEDGSRRRLGLPEGRELRRPGSVDLEFESPGSGSVRPIARLGDAVEPLVIDDFVTEPAYDPVIGPDLAAARTRVGLTVDELAERTRIRPHVIESIEVDDFAPCGGDFYARGHLRTLARVLGQDPGPLLQKFDDRYATAPINARRVFEAELATGMTGSMRSTVGGPNWGLLVGAVLSLVLVWGLVRLFATEPPELIQSPTPILNGSNGVASSYPKAAPAAKRPLPVAVVGTGESRVVVRNGEGKIVWAGRLDAGERKAVRVAPPVRVQASDAGAVEVRVSGERRGAVGEPGEPGRRTFTRTAR